MAEYRMYIIATGQFLRAIELFCPDDESAKKYAKQLVDGCDVELGRTTAEPSGSCTRTSKGGLQQARLVGPPAPLHRLHATIWTQLRLRSAMAALASERPE
jgi:hypothetical protein